MIKPDLIQTILMVVLYGAWALVVLFVFIDKKR
jgi:hypothetical protein